MVNRNIMGNLNKENILAVVGVVLSIALVSGLSAFMDNNILLAPFAATSVIAFLGYQTKVATPKNIISAYSLTCMISVLIATFLGHNWWTYSIGVGVSILVKQAFNIVHPPSTAMPIILLNIDDNNILDLIEIIVTSVLPGIIIMVLFAILFNRYFLRKDYPIWADYRI